MSKKRIGVLTSGGDCPGLNAVIRGVAQYFSTDFATVTKQLTRLDRWTRVRIRSMKTKRIWRTDNYQLKNKYLRRMGLVSLTDFL